MSFVFLRDRRFWATFAITFAVYAAIFGWQLQLFAPFWSGPIRPPVTTGELVFAVALLLIVPLDIGLVVWGRRNGTCSIGTRNATGLAGLIGSCVLVCPACTLVPLAFVGTSASLAALNPFMPLLRMISLIIALAALAMLWPRHASTGSA